MERVVLVYTTYPSLVEAEKAGEAVVKERLAACVNILPGMVSHYWWEGKVERGQEVNDALRQSGRRIVAAIVANINVGVGKVQDTHGHSDYGVNTPTS